MLALTEKDKFLNQICEGLGNTGKGYWFSAESEVTDTDGVEWMEFEFSSTAAPEIRIRVNKQEFEQFFTEKLDNENHTTN